MTACQRGDDCPLPAIALGLGRSNLALCAVHLPEYISMLQRDLTEVSGDLHKALSVLKVVVPDLAGRVKYR